MKWLIYGSTGQIARKFIEYICKNDIVDTIIAGVSRMENFDDIKQEIQQFNQIEQLFLVD